MKTVLYLTVLAGILAFGSTNASSKDNMPTAKASCACEQCSDCCGDDCGSCTMSCCN